MKTISIYILLLSSLAANAATVQFSWTNWDGTVSTNDLVITMITQPINDGTYTIKGLPRRYSNPTGFLSTNILSGDYSVVPYGLDIEPVLFAVPNDSQTYDYWQLRISGGNTYNYSPGVQQLIAGSGTSLSPSNGKGVVTVTSTGSGGIGAVAAGSSVNVSTNSNLYTVSLPFTPQIASSTLSNYATVGTNYWYPTNNPQGFISSNNVPAILGYVTNVVTTNSSIGVTNIINAVIAATPIGNLSNVKITSPVNGNTLTYQNGNWTNAGIAGTVTSVGLATPTEFSVSGSPVTGSGTITVSKANQNANLVYAGPSSGPAAAPTFRALVAADIPPVSSTVYASNILSGGTVAQSVLASNPPANGWFLASSNGFNFWTLNMGAATNLQSANLIGTVPTANLGSGTANSSKFLRGDQTWANTLLGNFTISSGNFTNSGNSSLDNGAILSDGSGNLTALKHIGQHYGQGVGLTNVACTNLIGVLPDARISNNIPRLETVNVFANNNLFSSSVEFDGGVIISGNNQLNIAGAVDIGASATMSSNKFQVVNSLGRYTLESQTNGSLWIGTNHQFYIGTDGSVFSDGASNHLNHQLVSDSQLQGLTIYGVNNYYGNAGSGLSNLVLALDPNQLTQAGGNNMLHIIGSSSLTNLSLWGQTTIAPSGQLYINGYVLSNNVSTSELTLANAINGTPMETMNGSTMVHKFSDSVVGVAASNNFSGIVKIANLSASTITNGASAGSKIQGTDANGKLVDTTDGSTLVSLNASQLSSGTIPTARFPALGSVYPDAITNNETRTPKFTAGLTSVGTTRIGAAIITNASSASTVVNLGLDSSGNVTTNVSALGTGSSGSDSSAWHQSGDNAGTIIGNTNSGSLQIRGAIPAGGQSVTFIDFEATSTPGINIYGGLTNGCISATTFQSLVWGGQHNTINAASTTADSIVGGQFNFIDPGGGGNYGATILGGASNHVAGTGSYAMGVGARAINDYAFVWCGLPNRIVTTSGGGGDNGKMMFAFSNAGIEFTNGNDASICGDLRLFGQALYSTNTAEANAGTFGWTNGSGGFSLVWNGTNSPYAGRNNKIINGSLGGSNSVVFGTQVKPQAFQIDTNGNTRLEGNLVVLGSTTTSGAGLSAGSVPYSALAISYPTNIGNHFADVGNSTTSDTTLYSDSVSGSTLAVNGAKIRARYGLNTVAHATATRQIKLFFGGTSILDTGAIITASTGAVDIDAMIIRDSSTSIRYDVRATSTGGTITNFVSVGKLTGLTLSSANTIELHGQAGATGAASNDIVATLGTVNYEP